MIKEPAKPKKEYKPSDFKLGESVKVLSMNINGTVASLPDNKGNLTVLTGKYFRTGDHRREARLS